MASKEAELPEGWTVDKTTVTVYEWRCPRGDKCGKGYKLLYKKQEYMDAITAGAWHLFDKTKHGRDEFTSFDECEIVSAEGITNSEREYDIYLDELGAERPKPSYEKGGGKGTCLMIRSDERAAQKLNEEAQRTIKTSLAWSIIAEGCGVDCALTRRRSRRLCKTLPGQR